MGFLPNCKKDGTHLPDHEKMSTISPTYPWKWVTKANFQMTEETKITMQGQWLKIIGQSIFLSGFIWTQLHKVMSIMM
jgi:hypothetical protein